MVALRTFKNLSDERRHEITLVALEEFALRDYQAASLSSIIQRLDLAKGSFYRYFRNKQSLYFYLLDTCVKERILNDKTFIANPSDDFFELLVQHFIAKIHFDRRFPLHSAFLHNVLHERNNKELGDIQGKSKATAIKIIKKMIDVQIGKRRIRSDMDIEILAFFVFKTQVSITDFLGMKYGINFDKRIRQRKPLYDIADKDILLVSRNFAELLRNGMALK